MQFTQTFPTCGQPFTFNTPFQHNGHPEIVGEGNVTSIMSPDGSTQLLFLPTAQWWQPLHTDFINRNWPPTSAWFIRRVFSPLPPVNCNQAFLAPNGIELPRNYSSQYFVNTPTRESNFELKFHNDICTSTSDIHYFYPSLRPYCDWLQHSHAFAPAVQDAPMAGHYDIFCTKPCNCTPANEVPSSGKDRCGCAKTFNASVSSMSCESEETVCHRGKPNQSSKEKNTKKSKRHKCECKKGKTNDKSVTTYADQASGSVAEKGRTTQTECGSIPVRKATSGDLSGKRITAELWLPKTATGKRAIKIKSSENFKGVCESGCCSGNCSCHSDTD